MSAAAPLPPTLALYRRFCRYPGGQWLFGRVVCLRAPYFATIRPRFLNLEPNRCVAMIKKRRAVHNHLGTVHAIAMANLCELVAGMAMEATVPATMRWIPKSMTIDYVKKAETDVTATAEVASITTAEPQDSAVAVSVKDRDGQEVVRATITMYVSPKKAGKSA